MFKFINHDSWNSSLKSMAWIWRKLKSNLSTQTLVWPLDLYCVLFKYFIAGTIFILSLCSFINFAYFIVLNSNFLVLVNDASTLKQKAVLLVQMPKMVYFNIHIFFNADSLTWLDIRVDILIRVGNWTENIVQEGPLR